MAQTIGFSALSLLCAALAIVLYRLRNNPNVEQNSEVGVVLAFSAVFTVGAACAIGATATSLGAPKQLVQLAIGVALGAAILLLMVWVFYDLPIPWRQRQG